MGWDASERETTIRLGDETDRVVIWTAQRPVITQLKKRDAFTLVRAGEYDGHPWAEFETTTDQWTLWSGVKRKITLTDEQRQERGARLQAARG